MRDPVVYLRDMVDACGRIERFAPQLVSEQGIVDDAYGDAVVYNLIVLGEAAKLVPRALSGAHPSIPWDEMARMRDALVHRYFGVEWAVVIDTAENRVPQVRADLVDILAELDAEGA